MTQSEKIIRDKKICVLCGRQPASTGQGDHIPPKSIYTIAERQAARYRFNTVPACITCNGAGSQHDESIKLMLGLVSGESRQVPKDVIEIMGGTIGKNNRLASQLFSSVVRTPKFVSATFDRRSYEESISRMARGLYWTITNTILDPLAKMTVAPVSEIDEETFVSLLECARASPTTEINGGTLKCKLIPEESGEMMLLLFFDKHAVLVLIN